MLIILALVVTVGLEWLVFTRWLWEIRLLAIFPLTLLIPAISVTLLFQYHTWLGLAVLVLSLARVGNLIRVSEARMHTEYLFQATKRTSRSFTAFQLIALLLVSGILPTPFTSTHLPLITAFVQLGIAMGIVFITGRNIYATRYKQGQTFYADRELPTVSLLIPARNETIDLEECLRSALASDYPKLEVIVLDDCSQLQTSAIIKGFAHDGVRFVQGEEPRERWLAKNQAYEKLYHEASGELLLFCGVDVRFGPHAIKALVTEMLVRDKQMISVLPRRLSGHLAGAFIQPMRYWWELSLPRKLLNRPPVLSTTWLIRRKTLKKLGGFGAVSHSVIPEGFFARELIKTNDYSFVRANDTLGVETRKSFSEQRATVLRTRYPQLRRRPENVLLIVIADLLFLLGPFIGIVYGLVVGNGAVVAVSVVASGMLMLNHLIIVQLTSPANVAVALVNFPVEVLTEVVVTVVSMIRYEFGIVEWKDRNVCIPVMHVIPHLPKLSDS